MTITPPRADAYDLIRRDVLVRLEKKRLNAETDVPEIRLEVERAVDEYQRRSHLGPLKGLVIEESQRIQPDANAIRNGPHRAGLGVPMDLRENEIIRQAEFTQPGHGRFEIIAAGY